MDNNLLWNILKIFFGFGGRKNLICQNSHLQIPELDLLIIFFRDVDSSFKLRSTQREISVCEDLVIKKHYYKDVVQ